jgi:hypothetical protein
MSSNSAEDAMDAQNAYNAKIAAENAAISRRDADVARRAAHNITVAGNQDLALKVNQIKRLKSQTKSGFAARGVAVNTGSALNQQLATTEAVQNDMKVIAYNTKKNQMKALSAAERYEMLAAAGLRGAADQAQAYEEAAKVKADNIWTQGVMGAANTLADFYNKGMFDNMFSTPISTAANPINMAGTGGNYATAHIGAGGTTAFGM